MLTGNIDKAVWAAYASEARVNIMDCLNTTVDFRGGEILRDDAHIDSWINTLHLEKQTPEFQFKLEIILRRYFRFLNAAYDVIPEFKDNVGQERSIPIPAMSTPDPARLVDTLKTVFTLIAQFRNLMMHPTSTSKIIEKKSAKVLNQIFIRVYEAGWRTTRSRIANKQDLDDLLLRKEKGKINDKNPLFLFDYPAVKDKDRSSALHDVLTDYGLGFLLSCFLSDKSTIELMSIVTRSHSTLNPSQRAIGIDIARVSCLWMPYRIRTTNTEDSVTIKAFSHLLRCPKTLYDRLGPADRDWFHGELEEENEADNGIALKNIQVKNAMLRGGEERNVRLAMELMDFNPCSPIRFAVSLGHLYHSVRIKSVTEYLDGQPRIRRIGNPIQHYGLLHIYQLNQLSGVIPPRWDRLQKNSKAINQDLLIGKQQWLEAQLHTYGDTNHVRLPSYIVEQFPKFTVLPERIEIRLTKQGESAVWPDLKIDRKTSQELIPDQLNELGVGEDSALHEVITPLSNTDMEPQYTLSSKQLMHLSFLSVLIKNRHDDPGKQNEDWAQLVINRIEYYQESMIEIIKAIENYHRTRETDKNTDPKPITDNTLASLLFQEDTHSDYYPIRTQSLPIVLRRYLDGVQDTPVKKTKILDRVQNMVDQTNTMMSQLDFNLTSGKKRGKEGFQAIKCGNIADFLSEDLLRFQPSFEGVVPGTDRPITDGGKINSEHYQILQHTLAYYSKYLDEQPKIAQLLQSCGFYETGRKHPFLERLGLNQYPEKYQGLLDFYFDYLKAREAFLSEQKKQFKKNALPDKLPNWLRISTNSTIETWLESHSTEVQEKEWELQYESKPQPLPRDFFYWPVLKLVADTLGQSPDALEKSGTRHFDEVTLRPSVTWLIARYSERRFESGVQDFYTFDRSHKVFKQLKTKRTDGTLAVTQQFEMAGIVRDELAQWSTKLDRTEKELKEKRSQADKEIVPRVKKQKIDEHKKLTKQHNQDARDYDAFRKNYHRFKRSERQIRQQSAWDQLLYLLAENQMRALLKAGDENQTLPRLSDLDKNFLKHKIDYRLPILSQDRRNEKLKRRAVLVAEGISIKDMLKLHQTIQDRGMYHFLGFLPAGYSELPYELYKAERTCYPRVRFAVLTAVHEFEIQLDERVIQHQLPPKDPKTEIRHRELLKEFGQHLEDTKNVEALRYFQQTRELAIQMRNAVAHNTYPETADVFETLNRSIHEDIIQGQKPLQPTIIERLGSQTIEIYQRWTVALQAMETV